jgi:hypothetical protein
MTRRLMVLGASVLAGATLACGSSSNRPTAPKPTEADTVAATPALTGYVYAFPSTYGNHRNWFGNDTALVGDNNTNVYGATMRAVLTFALPAIPTGATLQAATLGVTQCRVDSNPFTALGTVIADHLVPTAAPDSATYDTTAMATNVATVAASPTTTPATVDLTTSVAADYAAGNATSQYRLRFSPRETDTDHVSKDVAFCPPTLTLTFAP